jgi:hypothetical protein
MDHGWLGDQPAAMAMPHSARAVLRMPKIVGLSPEDMSRMEREMENLSQDLQMAEESLGRNVLNLVLVVGYLKKRMDNASVVRYLSQRHSELLVELQEIIETKSLWAGE